MQQVIYKLKITVPLLQMIRRTCQNSSGEKRVFISMFLSHFLNVIFMVRRLQPYKKKPLKSWEATKTLTFV